MNAICNKLNDFLVKYNINDPQETYLVAFSGGYDSMCLLDALSKICKNRIIAIHLNHNWRSVESDLEEQNCIQFCKKIDIEFYSEKLPDDIQKTETIARNARYDFFERCAKKYNSKIIFTAHNKNDNIETIIYRIAHGTGISGLQGINAKREIYYRPLLDIERYEIEKYCIENNLTPNFDSSNNDNIHKRNLIRSNIIPLLKDINPKAMDNINTLTQLAKEETEIINEYTNFILNKISESNKIKTAEFVNLSEPLQKQILYKKISPLLPQNYDRERILILWNFIKENKKSKSGKTISITTNKWLYTSEKYIEIIQKEFKNPINIHITKEGIYKNDGIIIDISKCNQCTTQSSGSDGWTIFANLRGLDFDFCIRQRQDGDYINPLGMNGTQKLKKYLNAKKIPNHQKDNILLLTQDKEVLWVVGYGLSNKIKTLTNPTHKISIKLDK